jgi:hypothetical protein
MSAPGSWYYQVLVEQHPLLPQESIALNHLEASPPCSNHHVSTWELVPDATELMK